MKRWVASGAALFVLGCLWGALARADYLMKVQGEVYAFNEREITVQSGKRLMSFAKKCLAPVHAESIHTPGQRLTVWIPASEIKVKDVGQNGAPRPLLEK